MKVLDELLKQYLEVYATILGKKKRDLTSREISFLKEAFLKIPERHSVDQKLIEQAMIDAKNTMQKVNEKLDALRNGNRNLNSISLYPELSEFFSLENQILKLLASAMNIPVNQLSDDVRQLLWRQLTNCNRKFANKSQADIIRHAINYTLGILKSKPNSKMIIHGCYGQSGECNEYVAYRKITRTRYISRFGLSGVRRTNSRHGYRGTRS